MRIQRSPWNSAKIATAISAVAIVGGVILLKDIHPHSESKKQISASRPSVLPTRPIVTTAALEDLSVAELQQRFVNTTDRNERSRIADALAAIGTGDATLALLTRILEEQDQATRRTLAESLKNLTHPEGLETLLSATVATDDPTILRQVIEAVGRLATPASVEFLVSLYRNEPTFPGQMRQVGKTLAHIRSPEAARMLGTIASTAPEPGLIEALGWSLAKIGNPTAVQGLVNTLSHVGNSDPTLRQSLLTALARVQSPSSAAFREQLLREDGIPQDLRLALQWRNGRF